MNKNINESIKNVQSYAKKKYDVNENETLSIVRARIADN